MEQRKHAEQIPEQEKSAENEIAASVQICAAGGGLAEISIDRSQKDGTELYRCEILSRILKARPENPGADPNQKPAITIHEVLRLFTFSVLEKKAVRPEC